MNFKLLLQKYLSGFDSFERHKMISSEIPGKAARILDVGGRRGQLSLFCGKPVDVLNTDSGDIVGDGTCLPFASNSYDVVTSLDVLEHIPAPLRHQFICELVRVARDRVILCFPYGSPQHEAVEKKILSQLTRAGVSDEMLEQHVQLGLPDGSEVGSYIAEQYNHRFYYSGDYRYNMLLFQVDHWMGNKLKLIKAGLSLGFNLLGNVLVFPLTFSRTPSYYKNRTMLVIEK